MSMFDGRPDTEFTMTDKAKQPIFICSLARSGTHWLQRSLSQSPELVGIEGINLILKFQELVEWQQKLHEVPESVWVKQEIRPERFLELLGDFYKGLIKEASGGHRFVESSPELNAICFRLIHQIFPDAFFIFLYRDGRNYVASMEKFSLMRNKEFDFKHTCRRWARIMNDFKEIEEEGGVRNHMLIRYEDMLDSFDDVFEKACSFVQIKKFRPVPVVVNTAYLSEPWVNDFNLRWKTLSKEKRNIFKEYAGPQLVDWGYADSSTSW
jgi:hypothetical protein